MGVDAREQRIDHAEAAAVRVPVVGRPKVRLPAVALGGDSISARSPPSPPSQRTHVAAIDALPIRRRGQGAIAAREASAAATADRIAAPLTKPVSTEANKRRLQAINSLKGGKALPEELTAAPISGNIPLSVMSSSAAASHRRRKAGSAPHSPTAGPDSAELREMRSMFNAITRELAEEEATLRAAQRRVDAAAGDAGAAERGASEVAAALQAIRSKVGDMQRLDGLMREEKARLRGLTQAHG